MKLKIKNIKKSRKIKNLLVIVKPFTSFPLSKANLVLSQTLASMLSVMPKEKTNLNLFVLNFFSNFVSFLCSLILFFVFLFNFDF